VWVKVRELKDWIGQLSENFKNNLLISVHLQFDASNLPFLLAHFSASVFLIALSQRSDLGPDGLDGRDGLDGWDGAFVKKLIKLPIYL